MRVSHRPGPNQLKSQLDAAGVLLLYQWSSVKRGRIVCLCKLGPTSVLAGGGGRVFAVVQVEKDEAPELVSGPWARYSLAQTSYTDTVRAGLIQGAA